MLRGSADPEARSFEVVDGTREIGDLGDGNVKHGTSRGFVGTHAYGCRARVGDDHACRTHDLGRADDGTEVPLVGHVVKDHHERIARARSRNDVGETRICEGSHTNDDTLVGTMARHRIEPCLGYPFAFHATTLETLHELVEDGILIARGLCHECPSQRNARIESLDHSAPTLDEVSCRPDLTTLPACILTALGVRPVGASTPVAGTLR